jgi:carbonic anhydrase
MSWSSGTTVAAASRPRSTASAAGSSTIGSTRSACLPHASLAEREAIAEQRARLDRLCELNVVRQVRNVVSDVFVREAWDRGQALSVHGWVYSLASGLVTDLDVMVSAPNDAGP